MNVKISRGKELETCGSDALADITAKIKFQEIHTRSYHRSKTSTAMFSKTQSVEKGTRRSRKI